MILRVLLQASPGTATAWACAVVLHGLRPTAELLTTAALIGSIPAATGAGLSSEAGQHLLRLLAILVGIEVAGAGLLQLQVALARQLRRRFGLKVRMIIGNAVLLPPGLAHMENSEIADEIDYLGGTERRSNLWAYLVSAVAAVANQYIVALGAVVILLQFRWWAPLVIGAAWITTTRWLIRSTALALNEGRLTASALRRAEYLRRTAAGSPAAKEIRIYGLASWVLANFREAWIEGMAGIWRERRRAIPYGLFTALLVLGAHALVLSAIWSDAAARELTLTSLVAFVGSVVNMALMGPGTQAAWWLAEGAALMPRLLSLADHSRISRIVSGSASATERPRQEIRFEHVDFSYPGACRPIFDGLTLVIPEGRSLAVVGENGAGKTTLIKLLARMYEPTGGRITVDGIDLRDLDLEEWRSRLSVILQDFTRFDLTLRDNIALTAGRDLLPDNALLTAASLAGAADLVARLPAGWDTPLSSAYEGGVDLSGGEWQRVALARALAAVHRGAGVLVLDEPTASLDVRAEAELFDRFLDVTRGTTTLLISHRFSTVRSAERIAVIDGGKVRELGSHKELVAADGLYAEMFRLQATRFRTDHESLP